MNPPATLSSLPLELKARIVELAHLQDLCYRGRWSDEDRGGCDLVRAARTELHGKSLIALSATSKDFNILAAVHFFRVSPFSLSGRLEKSTYSPIILQRITSKAGSGSYFTIRILPRHAASVRVLRLHNQAESNSVRRGFSYLPHLPHVDDISFDGEGAEELFDPIALLNLDPERQYAEGLSPDMNAQAKDMEEERALGRELFRTFAVRLRKLELHNFPPSDAADLLRVTPNLVALRLITPSLEDHADLRDVLGSAANLQPLTLEPTLTGANPELGPAWSTVPWRGQLTSLTLVDVPATPSMYLFIDSFAPSLRSLVLQIYEPNTPPPALRVFLSTFPHLAHLQLTRLDLDSATKMLLSLASTARSPLSSHR